MQKAPLRNRPIAFFLFLGICFAIAFAGSMFTNISVNTWYPTLHKAGWNPPAWVFAPVWTLLYFLIALSGWLAFRAEPSSKKRRAFWLYALQLTLNLLWSYLFFAQQSPLLALFDIAFLLIAIGWTIISFWPLSKIGSLLLVPYFLWVLYASSLNLMIWYYTI